MRVAMIGMGDIAAKAYLPVLAARPDLTPVLVSRRAGVLADLAARWRVAETHGDVAAAVRTGLDAAFVHAATVAHPDLVARLLDAGIPTYVDKPLADTLPAATRLVDLAEQRGVSLMVGFNRRFAPGMAGLAAGGPHDLVTVQKHRVDQPAAAREMVFDDFIHVVDTVRFLLPGPVEGMVVRGRRDADGRLERVTVQLDAGAATGFGLMNRRAGVNEEVVEVSGPGADGVPTRRRLHDLATLTVARAGREEVARRGDWTPVAEQRGFTAICDHFLAAVRAGRRLCARDALETHRLCERIVAALEPPPGGL